MQINTERLILRAMKKQDANRVVTYRGQPEVSLFQGWTPESEEEVCAHIEAMESRNFAAPDFWWQIALLTSFDNRVIGDVAFCIEAEQQLQAELGIALDTAYQKKGYASEAISALVGWLFEQHQLHRIHVSIDPRNQASINLFERAGFRHEGLLKQAVWFKGRWEDDLIMAILAEEWKTREAN